MTGNISVQMYNNIRNVVIFWAGKTHFPDLIISKRIDFTCTMHVYMCVCVCVHENPLRLCHCSYRFIIDYHILS